MVPFPVAKQPVLQITEKNVNNKQCRIHLKGKVFRLLLT